MSQTPFLTRAFDEVAKQFLKSFTKAADNVTGGSQILDVSHVIVYANASSCDAGASLKLVVQTSPDNAKWYATGSEITISNTVLSGRVVVQNCGHYVRVLAQYSGTGAVTIDALALEGIPK